MNDNNARRKKNCAKSGIKIMKLFEIRRIELISSVFRRFILGRFDAAYRSKGKKSS